MKKTLLFSDVHLKVSEAGRGQREEFTAFLRSFSPDEYDRVICLGDLFDFWFEYKHVIFSGCFDVLRAFADLHDAGMELHLICGNHDFWAGRFLRDELGFHIHQSSVELPFGTKTAHLVHGDGINAADRSYRLYKWVARARPVVSGFRLIHPDWAMAIARGVSHGSRTLRGVDDPWSSAESESLRAYARNILAAGKADVVFCGHAHAAVKEEHPTPTGTGLYINTGDRLVHKDHVVWDGADFNLHQG